MAEPRSGNHDLGSDEPAVPTVRQPPTLVTESGLTFANQHCGIAGGGPHRAIFIPAEVLIWHVLFDHRSPSWAILVIDAADSAGWRDVASKPARSSSALDVLPSASVARDCSRAGDAVDFALFGRNQPRENTSTHDSLLRDDTKAGDGLNCREGRRPQAANASCELASCRPDKGD
jgi:hypothetical protein